MYSRDISAIGKALNLALNENISHEIIKTLSDAGHLFVRYALQRIDHKKVCCGKLFIKQTEKRYIKNQQDISYSDLIYRNT